MWAEATRRGKDRLVCIYIYDACTSTDVMISYGMAIYETVWEVCVFGGNGIALSIAHMYHLLVWCTSV